MKTITVYSLSWTSPYTKPPKNLPECLVWDFLEFNSDRNELSDLLVKKAREMYPSLKQEIELGGGYSVSIDFYNIKPPTVRKAETVLKMRKQKTLKKLQKQSPLFWETEYQQTLLKNADYFDIGLIEKNQKQKLNIKLGLWKIDFDTSNQLRYL